MSHAEVPMSFREALPGYARDWCWLPYSTTTLTLDLPSGGGTIFQIYQERTRQMFAHNVAHITREEAP